MLVWSSLTALTGLAQSFLMLLLARMGLGEADAGAAPTLTALTSDIFTKKRPGTAMGFLYLSSPLGMTIGLALGGYIACHSRWRTALFVVGVHGRAPVRTPDPNA